MSAIRAMSMDAPKSETHRRKSMFYVGETARSSYSAAVLDDNRATPSNAIRSAGYASSV